MNRMLVLVLALAASPAVPASADAQAFGGAMASAPAARSHDRGGRGHGRADPVTRWERGLEQARARGNAVGRDPWNSYSPAPSVRFPSSPFPQNRLAGSNLWPGRCWGWRSDCGRASFAAMRPPGPRGAAPGDPAAAAGPAPQASAPPAVRRVETRPVVRGADQDAPRAYAHRVWRP